MKCATRHIGLRQQIADGIVARRRVAPRIGSGLFVAERAVGPCPNARAMGGLRDVASISYLFSHEYREHPIGVIQKRFGYGDMLRLRILDWHNALRSQLQDQRARIRH